MAISIVSWLLWVLAIAFAITLCVWIHYLGLSNLNRGLSRLPVARRARPMYAVFGALGLHFLEIVVFSLTAFCLEQVPGMGGIVGTSGVDADGFLDVLYLSAVSYTTIGYGEVVATGPLRALFAIEGLVGLTLITWSASFTFLEMERDWKR